MRKFYESTTGQLSLLILSVTALAAGFRLDDAFGWVQWADLAWKVLGFYGAKESIRYSAAAYEGKQ